MKVFGLLIFVFMCGELCAQLHFSEGISTSKELGMCAPGINNKSRSRGFDFSYTYINGGDFRDAALDSYTPKSLESLSRLHFKLKAPLINRPNFKLLLGFSHEKEAFTFAFASPSSTFSSGFSPTSSLPKVSSVFNDVHSKQMTSSGVGLYAVKPIDASRYTALRLKVAYNGDYDQLINFESRYRSISGTWAYVYKKHEDFEWGFGVSFNSNFRRSLALPFILYNRNFNEKWGIESVFPAMIQVRRNLNNKTILLGGYTFNSRNYSVDKDNGPGNNPAIYHLNHSELQFGLSLERQIAPWIWLNTKAGFQYNFNTRLEATNPEFNSYQVKPPHTPYFSVGIFLSPPDSMMK